MQSANPPPRRLHSGWASLERDDFRAAESVARAALAAQPQDVEALQLLGDSLFFQDLFREAIEPLSAAHAASRVRGVGHRLGYCYLVLGDFARAEAVLRQETLAFPDLVNAFNALGIALVNQQRREEALAAFRQALELDPRSVEAHNNTGNVLLETHRHEEAIPHFRKVVEIAPERAEPHHNLGNAYRLLKRYEEAASAFKHALAASPTLTYTLGNLIRCELAMCRWRDLERNVRIWRERILDPSAAEEPFVAASVSDSPEEQLLCARGYVRDKFPGFATARHAPAPRARRKLRLAYLSADFHAHATSHLIAGLLERHDRSKFEVFGVSFGPDDRSEVRARVQRAVDQFIDATAHDDYRVAQMLRHLEIDIAVDLKGYTADARPGILAHRPAPIQIAYLGFPGTSGAAFIDYLVADRFVVPPGSERWYSESIVFLPDTYQVTDDRREIPPSAVSRSEAGLPEKAFVFCCFNNNFKIRKPTFDIWMRLLGRVPGSVLWLLEDNEWARRNLAAEARAAGVDPARLVFASRVSQAQHLMRHRLADLFLDTLPYNAHTTASDALWAGLPLLTCAGNTFAGRVGGSVLHAMGLGELVTQSLEEYESLAMRLATEPSVLEALAKKLARHRTTHPLFDTDRFRRHMEAAYETAWRIRQAGEAPRSFAVPAQR